IQRDRRAGGRPAVDRDMSTRLRDKAVDLAKPESAALANFLRREERLEHALHDLRRHAFAAVSDRNRDVIAGWKAGCRPRFCRAELFAGGRDAHPASAWHRIAGVDDQI